MVHPSAWLFFRARTASADPVLVGPDPERGQSGAESREVPAGEVQVVDSSGEGLTESAGLDDALDANCGVLAPLTVRRIASYGPGRHSLTGPVDLAGVDRVGRAKLLSEVNR